MDLKGRNFLTLKDYTPDEITYLLDLAADLKEKKKKGILVDTLKGKNVALIFEKTSTRTRCSFEVAAHDLGMGTTYLDPSGSQIGKKESIADTARVLGRMYDGIEYRGFEQEIVEELAKLNDRGIDFIVSYDGMTGDKIIGKHLPEELNLNHIYINAGLSAQATLSGKKEITYESLYTSKNLKCKQDESMQLEFCFG